MERAERRAGTYGQTNGRLVVRCINAYMPTYDDENDDCDVVVATVPCSVFANMASVGANSRCGDGDCCLVDLFLFHASSCGTSVV
jgi:hypothetical protein